MPLIGWSICSAQQSGAFCDILVSTEDQEIADVAVSYGARVPWIRPPELASDTASAVDVLLHELDQYETMAKVHVSAVMLLQPTSPFRRPSTIRRAVALFQDSDGSSVIGVSQAKTHPYWCFVSDEKGDMRPFVSDEGLTLRSQDLPPAFEVNGCLYLTNVKHLRKARSLYTKPFRALLIEDPVEALDIDTSFDWKVAEACLPNIEEGAMSDLLKGNFKVKQAIEDNKPTSTAEEQFEREALKKLGGSIAFVSKQKVMWDKPQSEDTKKEK
jgi:CMP-N-acetylneuraminic acid synthetase